jgi:Zn-finger nucleic acid-binding protein
MTQANRQGVEIDICPQCRGVWLDRGELEKLLEPIRNEARAEPPREDYSRSYDRGRDDHHGRDEHHGDQGRNGRRRNSILDIFD